MGGGGADVPLVGGAVVVFPVGVVRGLEACRVGNGGGSYNLLEADVVDGRRRVGTSAAVVAPHEDHFVDTRSGYLENVVGIRPIVLTLVEFAAGNVNPASGNTREGRSIIGEVRGVGRVAGGAEEDAQEIVVILAVALPGKAEVVLAGGEVEGAGGETDTVSVVCVCVAGAAVVGDKQFGRAAGGTDVPLVGIAVDKQPAAVLATIEASVIGHGGRKRVGLESGGVGGVGRYGNRARVVHVAVLPLHEVVAAVGRGGQCGRGVAVVAAAAADAAHDRVVGHGSDGVLMESELHIVDGSGRLRATVVVVIPEES